MPNFATEPLTRITINLFSKDLQWYQSHFGTGYQVEIRKILRKYRKEQEAEDED